LPAAEIEKFHACQRWLAANDSRLAALIDAEDEIAEVTPDFIAILKTRRDLLRFRQHAA